MVFNYFFSPADTLSTIFLVLFAFFARLSSKVLILSSWTRNIKTFRNDFIFFGTL